MWRDKLLQEVLSKYNKSNRYLSKKKNQAGKVGDTKEGGDSDVSANSEKNKITKFYIGGKYKDVYFTPREAETMMHILLGKTMASMGEAMGLSTRTIEFYITNMKRKLFCRTKEELIGIIVASDFLDNLLLED